jgi:diadenylate cyclase
MELSNLPFLLDQLGSLRALVDIALLGMGLFFLYRTLLRLGTWQIALGVGAAFLLYLVAMLLDLRGIEWVLGNVSHVAVIGLIVIFQPELRKLFERAVTMRTSSSGDRNPAIAEVVETAVAALIGKKRGALIVFPGREPLREWLAGGIALNAEASVPLLLSIFDPHSPGHDGAVIVANDRFASYSVRLPVSNSSKLPPDYGTRHHAALGLSEKTDALVLAVSEERGSVTLFRGGGFRRLDPTDRIKDAIVDHMTRSNASPFAMQAVKNRRDVFVQMLISLALAVFFWSTLIIAQAQIVGKVVSVPVEYAAPAANLVMVGEKQQSIQLHLTGPKSDLDATSPTQLAVKIDLSKAAAGEQTVFITSDMIRLPRGVRLLDAFPERLVVTLAEIVAQDLPITPQLVGKLQKGLQLKSVRLSPAVVTAMLPTAAGDPRKPMLTTTPIYLDGITERLQLFCKIIAPPSVQPVDKRWPDVEVTIDVEPGAAEGHSGGGSPRAKRPFTARWSTNFSKVT